MSAKAMYFSGVARAQPRRPIVAPAPSTASVVAQSHPVAGFSPLTQQSRYRRAFFRTGELDGAEGIDGAET